MERPCEWDTNEPCVTCKEVKKIPTVSTCFAYCFDERICGTQKSIDFEQWEEMYEAVRCMRNRARGRAEYFPGFCKHHNEINRVFVENYWTRLGEHERLLLNYMIDGSVCSIKNIDRFLYEHRDTFSRNNVTVHDILRLCMSPVGIVTVTPVYLQTFLDVFLTTTAVDPAQIQHMLDPNVSDQEVEAVFQQHQQTNSYECIVAGILQPSTVHWLMDQNACIRSMNWNMLFHQVAMVFMLGTFPRFSANWEIVWNRAAESVVSTLPTNPEIRTVFTNHWTDLMENIKILIKALDEVPIVPDMPIVDIKSFLDTPCEEFNEE